MEINGHRAPFMGHGKRDVGERLYLLRRALKMPQIIISEACGIKTFTWSAVERGRSAISVKLASRIRQQTGATLDFIYCGEIKTLPPKLRRDIQKAMDELMSSSEKQPKKWSKRDTDKLTAEQRQLLANRREHMRKAMEKWTQQHQKLMSRDTKGGKKYQNSF